MTIKELYSLYYIEQEIKEYELKIVELKEMATNITANYTGITGGGNKSDKVGNAAAAIVHYTKLLEDAIQRDVEQSIKINAFILEIEDAQLRNIMYLRFVKRLSWQCIANRIGGGNKASGVRMRCKRYIDSYNKKTCAFCATDKHYNVSV